MGKEGLIFKSDKIHPLDIKLSADQARCLPLGPLRLCFAPKTNATLLREQRNQCRKEAQMLNLYLYAKNNNLAIRERKRTIADLRQTSICINPVRHPQALRLIKIQDTAIIIAYQPVKKRRSKKYHAFYPRGAFFVPRPPTNTGMKQ